MTQTTETITQAQLIEVDPLELSSSPWQTRHFPEKPNARLLELAESIKASGIQQPPLVRPIADGYEIVFGERRVRAARHLGLDTIRVLSRHMSDEEARDLCIVENMQRQNLHPLEEARAVAAYIDDMTQEEVAAKLGKSPQWIARRARLVHLTDRWRDMLDDPESGVSEWSIGHIEEIARLPAETQDLLADQYDRRGNRIWAGATSIPRLAELRYKIADTLRHLAAAPWSLDDPDLDGRVACSECLDRSDRNPDLFDDLDDMPMEELYPDDFTDQEQEWFDKETEKRMAAAEDEAGDDFDEMECEEKIQEDLCRQIAKRRARERAEQGLEAYCLNKQCFEAKAIANLKRRIKQAREQYGKDLMLYGFSHDSPFNGKQYPTAQRFEWDTVKANTPDARPAIVISGDNKGKMIWIKPNEYNSDTTAGNIPNLTPAEELAAKRQQLERLRTRVVLRLMHEDISSYIDDPVSEHPGWQPSYDESQALALIIAWGTSHRRASRFEYDMENKIPTWSFAAAAPKDDGDKIHTLELSALDNIVKCLRDLERYSNALETKKTQDFITETANYLGFNLLDLRTRAAEQKPEPKSWQKLIDQVEKAKAKKKATRKATKKKTTKKKTTRKAKSK